MPKERQPIKSRTRPAKVLKARSDQRPRRSRALANGNLSDANSRFWERNGPGAGREIFAARRHTSTALARDDHGTRGTRGRRELHTGYAWC